MENDRAPEGYLTYKAEFPSPYSIQEMSSQRNYKWPSEAEIRLGRYRKFVAAEIEYQSQCKRNFYSDKMKPVNLKSSKKKAGRHKDEDIDTSFQLLCPG